MLDIIRASQISDVGIIAWNPLGPIDNLVYMLPKMCENSKGAQLDPDKIFGQG